MQRFVVLHGASTRFADEGSVIVRMGATPQAGSAATQQHDDENDNEDEDDGSDTYVHGLRFLSVSGTSVP
ncbi:hypothetical protein [Streptomyces sp. NPDC050535]|uniref:hypothetical protein n=1 Tax=Streptomyces sp. NPDC050535 TaxID=3365626 RepID=UPI0037AD1F21